MKSVLLTLFTIVSLGLSAQNVPNNVTTTPPSIGKVTWDLSSETKNFQNFVGTSNFNAPITQKLSFTNFTMYETQMRNNPQTTTFLTTVSYFNYEVNPRFVVSTGYQYMNNYTWDFNVNTFNVKATFRVLK